MCGGVKPTQIRVCKKEIIWVANWMKNWSISWGTLFSTIPLSSWAKVLDKTKYGLDWYQILKRLRNLGWYAKYQSYTYSKILLLIKVGMNLVSHLKYVLNVSLNFLKSSAGFGFLE